MPALPPGRPLYFLCWKNGVWPGARAVSPLVPCKMAKETVDTGEGGLAIGKGMRWVPVGQAREGLA